MARELADPYSYQGSGVLTNLPAIRDARVLATFEHEQTYARTIELSKTPPPANFDFEHLKSIHGHLFQDVYAWAGQIRTTDLSKGKTTFERVQNIAAAGKRIGNRLHEQNNFQGLDKRQFVERISSLYADLNALHPFREGNGRTTREFISQVARAAGYELDQTRIENNQGQWNQASAQSIQGDSAAIKLIFSNAIRPSRAVAFETLSRQDALARHPELARTFNTLDAFKKALPSRYPDNQKGQDHFFAQARTEAVRRLDQGIPIAAQHFEGPEGGVGLSGSGASSAQDAVHAPAGGVDQTSAYRLSLTAIDDMAKTANITTGDPATLGKSFKGEVVGVSAHHTLLKISEGHGVVHENETLSRGVKVGDKVQMNLDPARELARAVNGVDEQFTAKQMDRSTATEK